MPAKGKYWGNECGGELGVSEREEQGEVRDAQKKTFDIDRERGGANFKDFQDDILQTQTHTQLYN